MEWPYWQGDTLMVYWYGSHEPSALGTLRKNTNPRYRQPWVFRADTVDDMFVRRYYERPTAAEVFKAFLNWQRG